MKPISDFPGLTLRWLQVNRRAYDLRAGDETIATLRWRRAAGSLATGESAEGRWTLKRVGFFRTHITVRVEGREADLATMHRSARGESRLDFADSRSFIWKPTRERRREMGFYTSGGELLLRLMPESRLFRYEASLELGQGRIDPATLALLAIVGWYRSVLQHGDEIAAAAAAAGAAAA